MKKITICDKKNITQNLKLLQDMGYKYIIKAQDKFLSGWGYAEKTKHIQLIACKTEKEKDIILNDLYSDNCFSYVNWDYITNKQAIYNYIRNKTYTIRNDWTRCFKEN